MHDYPEIRMLIGDEWRKGASSLPIINPADESKIGTVPVATANDIDDAISEAVKGQRVWQRMAPAKRAEIMLKAAGIVRDRVEQIAVAITLEQGKPIGQSRLEVLRACDIVEWDAQEGRRAYGRIIPAEPGMRHTVLRQPIGVVAAFSPWNFPISSPARKVAGALAAGCAVILKPSEETPAGAMLLASAFREAGVPAGVVNLLYGIPADISSHLVRSPDVRLLTFTGSTAVGRQLGALAGQNLKPAVLELGGHAPVIVCDDVDPADCAAKSVLAKSRNAGQICVAPTRFFVADAIYDRFVDGFRSRAADLTIGSPLDPATGMGPLANERRLSSVEALYEDALARGARDVSSATVSRNSGYFTPLRILCDVPDEALAMQQEPFGPLALLQRVENLDEAISKANALPYGLAAYAFTRSALNAERLATEVECGNLSINHFVASVAETPFGGVKDSGYGREGGVEGLEAYMTVKNISHLVQ